MPHYRPPRPPVRRFGNAAISLLSTVSLLVLGGLGAWAGVAWVRGDDAPAPWETTVWAHWTGEEVVEKAPVVLYLNREGARLLAGPDDAAQNRSSILTRSAVSALEVDAFIGSNSRWKAVVQCIRKRFAPYDIQVVDRRPTEGPYTMAVIGGKAGPLVADDHHGVGRLGGLAPMPATRFGHVEGAVVLVFARTLRERTQDLCDTTAQEVAHTFGLDHVMDCRDPMTYLKRCGRRAFQDVEAACGEAGARVCANGTMTQNSHRRLLNALGPNPEVARAAERPVAGYRGQPSDSIRVSAHIEPEGFVGPNPIAEPRR